MTIWKKIYDIVSNVVVVVSSSYLLDNCNILKGIALYDNHPNIVLALDGAFVTLIKILIEYYFCSKIWSVIDVKFKERKSDISDHLPILYIRKDTTRHCIVYISSRCAVNRLIGKELTIKFPKGITVTRDDYVGLLQQKEENEIQVDLSDSLTGNDGIMCFRVELLVSSDCFSKKENVKCMISGGRFSNLFITLHQSELAIEIDRGE